MLHTVAKKQYIKISPINKTFFLPQACRYMAVSRLLLIISVPKTALYVAGGQTDFVIFGDSYNFLPR